MLIILDKATIGQTVKPKSTILEGLNRFFKFEANKSLHEVKSILKCPQCFKREQAEIGTSEFIRRAPALIGGFLMLVWQSSKVQIKGGLLSGSLTACRYLMSGSSKPESSPRPSIGTESGIYSKTLGADTMARKPIIRNLGFTPSIPQLFAPSFCFHSRRVAF